MCFDIWCFQVQSVFCFLRPFSFPVQMCILQIFFLICPHFSLLTFLFSLRFFIIAIIVIIIINFSFPFLLLLCYWWLGSSYPFNFVLKREGKAIYLRLFIYLFIPSFHHCHNCCHGSTVLLIHHHTIWPLVRTWACVEGSEGMESVKEGISVSHIYHNSLLLDWHSITTIFRCLMA